MYLCKALLNVCIYDKGAIKIRYNNNNNKFQETPSQYQLSCKIGSMSTPKIHLPNINSDTNFEENWLKHTSDRG